ncbi:MAG TPA: hypothetical protein VK358_03555, partial [Longimicrobium sp.]|nr:hypothetical protein [Longimicrobium sp.]
MQAFLLVLGSLVVGFLAGRLGPPPPVIHYVRVPPPPMNDALAPPGGSARASADHARELVGLADRLAARDICVRGLSWHPGSFWQLVLLGGADADLGEKGSKERRTRVFWEARENRLSVQWVGAPPDRETFSSPPPGLSAEQSVEYLLKLQQDAATDEIEVKLGRNRDPIGVAENLLIQRF